jgi:hypothetical protein
MLNILDLPREIRDLIYRAVLDSELSTPSSPAELRHNRKQMPSQYGSSEYFSEHCNQYPLQPVSISISSLLLTNRQIHREILDAIARLKAQKQLRYKIDCMIEDEKRIYPTWLSVLVVSFHIDVVEVDFRIFGQRDDNRSGFAPGNGGPGPLVWSLFALPDRFLERGPNFLSSCKTRQKIEVKLITLNVVTPSEPVEGFIPKDWRTNESRMTGVIHPESVLWCIKEYLGNVLDRTKYTAMYAKTVYGGVRCMKLMLDSKTTMKWNLVNMEAERQRATIVLEKTSDPSNQLQTTTISSLEQAKTTATTVKNRKKFNCFCICGRKSDTEEV